jgi:hypothetical protein
VRFHEASSQVEARFAHSLTESHVNLQLWPIIIGLNIEMAIQFDFATTPNDDLALSRLYGIMIGFQRRFLLWRNPGSTHHLGLLAESRKSEFPFRLWGFHRDLGSIGFGFVAYFQTRLAPVKRKHYRLVANRDRIKHQSKLDAL